MTKIEDSANTGTETGAAPAATTTTPETTKPARKPRKAKAAAKPKAKKAKVAKAKKARKAGKKGSQKAADVLRNAAKDYTRDSKVKTAGGNVSVHCGDPVAKKLLGKPLSDVYEAAAKARDLSVGTLKKKYGHLNPGMQRMTLGNMIRAGK